MAALLDEVGNTYGELTVIAHAGSREYGSAKTKFTLWKCQCSCGNQIITIGQSLRNGKTTACGHKRGNPILNKLKVRARVTTQKTVILMAQDGYNNDQIAAATGYKLSSIQTTLTLARTMLKMKIPYSSQRKSFRDDPRLTITSPLLGLPSNSTGD